MVELLSPVQDFVSLRAAIDAGANAVYFGLKEFSMRAAAKNFKLNELKKVAQSSENIMPIMIETVKTYATIQEICDVLRDVFGEYRSPQIF